jgi:tetratricopeptide (TPR) repeat protein
VRRAGRTTADRPRERREPTPTTRPRVEAPPLPDEAQPELLDTEIRKELRGLPLGLAEVVARHLVAAAMLLDEDAQLALRHARTAASLAARLPATREAAGIAAYHAGEYATALVELRTARRMDGSPRYLPMIADAERGLGRPERAVAYLSDPAAEQLDAAGRAELLIVGSGARRDLDQPEAAVVLLAEEANRPGEPRPWTARLRYAYAEALLEAGRRGEALRAFESVAAIDEEGETDADERAYELMTQQAAEPAPVEPAAPGARAAGPADETVGGDARVGKGVSPVLFDDGSAALGTRATDGDETSRREAKLPDLGVLFSGLGLREVPAAQRRPLTAADLADEAEPGGTDERAEHDGSEDAVDVADTGAEHLDEEDHQADDVDEDEPQE